MDTQKAYYTTELRILLERLATLTLNKDTPGKELAVLRSQIVEACNALDEIERYEASK